jgi:hypothetical protein
MSTMLFLRDDLSTGAIETIYQSDAALETDRAKTMFIEP